MYKLVQVKIYSFLSLYRSFEHVLNGLGTDKHGFLSAQNFRCWNRFFIVIKNQKTAANLYD